MYVPFNVYRTSVISNNSFGAAFGGGAARVRWGSGPSVGPI